MLLVDRIFAPTLALLWSFPLLAMSNDPCLSQCSLEKGTNGEYQVLCACSEKNRWQDGNLASLQRETKANFAQEIKTRLRDATPEEMNAVYQNECEKDQSGNKNLALCGCVKKRIRGAQKKTCHTSNAGELLCQFELLEKKSPAGLNRRASLQDYQSCIASRMNNKAETCLNGRCSEFNGSYGEKVEAKKHQISVGPEFSDEEKAIVYTALDSIPTCWKPQIQGVTISKRKLSVQSGKNSTPGRRESKRPLLPGGCQSGEAYTGKSISLDPECRIDLSVVLHELFHILGWNGLYKKWGAVLREHPNCPVTKYGATKFEEDFAEAGMLLFYPDRKQWFHIKNPEPCVEEKIAALGKILEACPF